MEAHGGYLCRLEEFDAADLVRNAREALLLDGESAADCALLVTVIPMRKVVRLAYDAVFTYGRRGAGWYEEHHALPKLLSSRYNVTVHAYVFDPEEYELVTTYGAGGRVGGERMQYADAPLPDDEDTELDELSFERLKAKWPIGHLGKVYGVTREELLRMPRSTSLLLTLDGGTPENSLSELLAAPRAS